MIGQVAATAFFMEPTVAAGPFHTLSDDP